MIFHLQRICIEHGIPEDLIHKFVNEEWIIPLDKGSENFDEEDVSRILLIRDLLLDMDVNEEAVPIILNLLDQIHALQSVIRKLQKSGE